MPAFAPDYRHIVDVARNRRPQRLPLYEHNIAPQIMGQVLGRELVLQGEAPADYQAYYREMARFWQEMTYDTMSFEGCVCEILPDHGALMGGRPGPIQNREDFERYPWDDLPRLYWERFAPHLEALASVMPPGMKAHGGVGNGVFEISEDLVGYEWLCLLQYDDPELFRDLYRRIGDLLVSLWTEMLQRHRDLFAFCRMGDDLGYKSSTMLAPETILTHIVPQYRRVIDLVHGAGQLFVLHSCGCIFDVMDSILEAGIDGKHSNEDAIAPFGEWIRRYGDRIGLFGGIDVDLVCSGTPQTVFDEVRRQGAEYRRLARGFALGTGNSIPDYVPVDNYRALIEGSKAVRTQEA